MLLFGKFHTTGWASEKSILCLSWNLDFHCFSCTLVNFVSKVQVYTHPVHDAEQGLKGKQVLYVEEQTQAQT